MKTITNLNFLLTTLLMFALIPSRLQATHATGMQLTYTQVSGLVYKFRCEVFRDCNTIPPPAVMYMQVSSATCGFNQSFTLNMDTSQTTEIVLTCATASTNCNGGLVPGFQKIVYENVFTLSGPCSDWFFEVTQPGRYGGITTLQNPGSTDLYVSARLNNLTAGNSSSQFTNDPIIFVCKDQDFHYNHGMFDPDGDSISYRLVDAKSAANTPIQYSWGYTFDQPVTSVPPVTFDDFTGDLFIHSTVPEITVFAYEVRDWRNGVIVGAVIRDVILFTVPCTNNFPTATGINGTAQQILYVFPDDTVCFDVLSDDIDVNDTVTMTWNQTIPAATFVTNGNPHPTGTFCWMPTIIDLRPQPYMFTVMVRDNFCPMDNACIYSYFIYVTQDSALVLSTINNPIHEQELSVYPNPSSGLFTLNSDIGVSEIKIYNYAGDCIRENILNREIDLREESAGIYFLEITATDGKRKVQKLVKTKSD